MTKKLAIHGGKKTRLHNFPAQPGPDASYLGAAMQVLERKILSGYRGNAGPAFWGGRAVQQFEHDLEQLLGIPHAIACSSATAGLWMACAAIGLKPGDEVIVTPWSMSCSATVPLLFGAIPVFADIDPETFCLDPDDVEKKLTPRTRAIIAVDLFGQTYDGRINELAKRHGAYVIEDAAQAIGAEGWEKYRFLPSVGPYVVEGNKQPAGCLGDIGVFSFTQGKHMTAGEGGCCVTRDADLARRLAMLRNHAEAVEKDNSQQFPAGGELVGLNLRMTEIQAAILCRELQNLGQYIADRQENVIAIETVVKKYGCRIARPKLLYSHVYYVCPILLSEKLAPRAKEIAAALREELMPDEVRLDRGVPVSSGYIDPLYLMPVFQLRQHWAFGLAENEGHAGVYAQGTCPVAERLTAEGLVITLLHGLALKPADREDVLRAFDKVLTYYAE